MNQFEVYLIGTGNYGESVVINLGMNNWIVIDSCVTPIEKEILPLSFLKSKGVNIEQDVKLIICTHWHDDHIKGISKILEECKSAKFSMAMATDKTKFLQFISYDYSKYKNEATAVSTEEINKCLEIINKEERGCILAAQDKQLFYSKSENYKCNVFSLSPSDEVLKDYATELSSMISEISSNRKIVNQSPNDKCVVLLVSVNNHSILLGADLEVTSNNKKGWICIIENSLSIKSNPKASLFKIPHHGSETGYHKKIFEELLSDNCIAEMTSCHIGNLPQKEMIKKFFLHTDNLYITSLPKALRSTTPKKRPFSNTQDIKHFNPNIIELPYLYGIVSAYINYKDSNDTWHVSTEGNALKLNKDEYVQSI